MTPTLKFRDLNPVGRITILLIGLLTLGIAAVAFALSYDALYTWVSGLGLWSDKANRIFPLLLDAAFVIAQGAAILAGVMRAILGNDQEIHRGWPITAMLISGTLTIWFNVLHAGSSWSQRIAAALPPVLMMVAFEIDVSIVKWVMKALGKPLNSIGAAPLLPAGWQGHQLPYPAPAPTMVYRPDQAPYGMVPPAFGPPPGPPPQAVPAGWTPQGQMPTWAPSQIQQTGQPSAEGNGTGDQAEATKRRQVEAHLATLGPDQLQRLGGLGPKAGARELTPTLNGQGVQVSERYVQQILDEYLAGQRTNGARKRK